MKQTRTTLKELTAMYRAVLRHGILCNAIALGLIATATPAMAVRDVNSVSTWNTAFVNGGESSLSADILNPRAVSGAKQFDIVGNNHTITGGVSGTPTFVAEQNAFKFHYVDTDGITKDLFVAADGVQRKTSDASLLVGAEVFSDAGLSESVGTVGYVSSSIFGIEERKTVGSYAVDTDFGVVKQEPSRPTSTSTYYTIKLTNAETNDVLYVSAYKKIQDGYTAEDILSNSTLTFRADADGSALSGVVLNSHDAGTAQITKYDNLTGTVFLSDPHAEYTVGDRSIYVAPGTDINSATDAYVSAKFNTSNQIGIKNNGLVLNLPADTTSTISDITMKDFSSTTSGGAIVLNSGELSVSDSTFTDNTATASGGAVYNEGGLTLTDSTFTGNSATANGGAIWNAGELTINGGAFTNNLTTSSGKNGGAIFNSATGDIDIKNGTTFTSNSATNGGAIDNVNGKLGIDGAIFTGNVSSKLGGAVRIAGASDDIEISGSEFTGNYANESYGGAIHNNVATGKTLTLNNNTFSGNGKLVDGNDVTIKTTRGGALYNAGAGTMKIVGGSITKNAAKDGGAIYVASGSLSIDGTSITDNMSAKGGALSSASVFNITNATIDGNVALNESAASYFIEGPNSQGNYYSVANGVATAGQGGAIYNSVSKKTSSIAGGSMSSNVAYEGGAIYNAKGTIEIDGTTFTGNTALSRGGALVNLNLTSNSAVTSIKDTTFTGNAAAGLGGAIYNSLQTLILDGSNTFSDNKSNVAWDENNNIKEYVANDIYNNGGTINIISGAGETNTFAGGIDGNGAAAKFNINGAGTVNVSNALTRNTVNVNSGELHLTKADLTGSTINVESGATINTIDDAIQDLSSNITLKNGAGVKGDIDYTAGLADKYSADSGANITYKLANALNLSGMQYGAAKEIRVTNTGATVNADANFAWYNAVDGLTLTSGGTGTGTVLVSGVVGGINAAVDATDETVQEITYSANAASETFDGADNEIQNADFSIVGNGSDANSNKIVFENNMIVDGKSTLALNDIVLEKTNDEAIVNQTGGTLNIKDSRIAVNVNNYGTLVSDPTYYDAKVVNAGDATFTEDVFENGSSLTNSATVNLNNVEFASGSTLTGLAGNVLNVTGTDNKFNGTSTGNNVVLANGAKFVGTLSGGSVDARNGGIDTITGSVSGGDLYVDANLNAGTVDTFGGTTGATVKGIKLAGTAYGDDDKVKLTIGEAALDSDVEIDGTNYFTSVVKDGNNIVFSDKLINESNLYKKLGSWTGGNYIKSNVDMTNTADANHLTVGGALAALDSAVATLNGDATTDGSVSKSISDALVDLAASNTYDAYGAADTAEQNAKTYVDNKGYQTASDVDSAMDAKITALDLDNVYANKTDVQNQFNAVHGEINDAKGYTDTTVAAAMVDTALTGDTTAVNLAVSGNLSVNGSSVLTAANMADEYDGATLDDARSYIATNGDKVATVGTTAAVIEDLFDAKQAWTDSTLGINSADADAVKNAYTGTTYLTDAESLTAADVALDAAIKDNKDAIDTLNGGELDAGSVKNIAKGYANTAEQNAKTYADDAIETALADYTTTDGMNTAIGDAISAAVGTDGAVTNAINTALADYSKTTDMNAAIADAITGALDDNGAVTTAINSKVADATTMGTGNKNFDDNVSAKDALVALDTAVGDMGGLANNTIAKEDNVVANLTALDNAAQSNADAIAAIENGTTVVAKAAADGSGNNIETTYATKSALSLMGGAVDENTAAIATLTGTGDGSVAQAAANAVEQANAYTDARLSALHDNSVEMANAYTDRRIEDLDKNLSAGVAGAVALSAVATSGVERGEVSVGAGYGYFNGQSAAAFGATMGLSNRWSINAGAGISNADVSFRAGTNYKFKLF